MIAIREQANRARNLPLDVVADYLGGCRSRHDKQRWDFPGCSIWIGTGEDSQRFYDHHAGRGGGGAIDMAMHVLGCSFKDALKTLMAMDGDARSPVSKAVAPKRIPTPTETTPFVSPKPCPQHQLRLIEFLTRARGLPNSAITHAVELGLVYLDSRRNAVFLCHAPNGTVTGAELRGTGTTPYKGMAPGSRRGVGFFTLTRPAPTQLVVVESALDALAYQALFPSSAATIVSTAGVLPGCPVLLDLASKLAIEDIAIAYDNDTAGEAASQQLMESLAGNGRTVRCRRPWLKDWNDILLPDALATKQGIAQSDGHIQADLFTEVI